MTNYNLEKLFNDLLKKKTVDKNISYTSSLLSQKNFLAIKINEESTEVILEYLDNNKNNGMWLIQSGIHGILTSVFAIEKGLDASFCKCYFYNNYIHTNILRKANRDSNNIAFLLGLGYKDESKHHYESKVTKAKINEVIKWV